MTHAPLRIADLDTHGSWVDVAVPDTVERDYRAVTGFSGRQPPAGLASVVARLAYTRGRPMPPGGVLREISQRSAGPPPADGRWQARISSALLGERSGRRRVAVIVALRGAPGGAPSRAASAATGPADAHALVASVRFLLDWPAGAA